MLPPDPPPATLPPGLYPIIGPEIATCGAVQPIARQMGLQILGTLHERIGDTLTVANTGGEGAGLARSDWARFWGKGSTTATRLLPIRAPAAGRAAFQGGVDLWRGAILPGHRDAAGVYVAFANSSIAVDGLVTNAAATGYTQVRTGTLGLNAYSVGGYWTHYGPGGWYLDALVQRHLLQRQRDDAIRFAADQRCGLCHFARRRLPDPAAARAALCVGAASADHLAAGHVPGQQ